MASVFFGKHTIVVKMFPHTDVVPVVVVMFFKCLYPIVMESFPVANREVVFIKLDRFDFFVLVVDCPLAVFFPFVVASDHRDIAKACPTFEFAMREAVFVRNFEFLDAVVVPFVTLEDGSVRVDPDGGLFDAICVPCEDMFFSPLDCTAGEIA